jgi:hypothetical protein
VHRQVDHAEPAAPEIAAHFGNLDQKRDPSSVGMRWYKSPPMEPRSTAWWVAAMLAAVILSAAPKAEAMWGCPYPRPRPAPPDQSWLADSPERPGARSRGKLAVFEFKGDDVYEPVRGAIVRLLRRRGFSVTVTLRPADTALEYREMSRAAHLAVFVAGTLSGEGERQRAVVEVWSGVTGHRVAAARFSGPTDKIVDEVARKSWTRLGPPIMRACAGVSRQRQLEREPLRIDAGDPDDT